MKYLILLALLGVALGADSARLLTVQTVYLLPMSSGMDQYLASALARQGGIQVVSDPEKADAIFTDRLGEVFQQKLDELYPKVEENTDDEDDNTSKIHTPPPLISNFSRGRGNYFLVDRKTRNLLWSVFDKSQSSRPEELHKVANRVIHRLHEDVEQLQASK